MQDTSGCSLIVTECYNHIMTAGKLCDIIYRRQSENNKKVKLIRIKDCFTMVARVMYLEAI